MDLNHVHLGTTDLAAFRAFHEGCFGFRKRRDHGDGAFLENDEGFMLAVDPVEDVPAFPRWFHLWLTRKSADQVKSLHRRVKPDRVRFAKELMEFEGEAAVFYRRDPDGRVIEVGGYAREDFE
ncbi:MAG: VOC family protein [Planctomycetota bacterium]